MLPDCRQFMISSCHDLGLVTIADRAQSERPHAMAGETCSSCRRLSAFCLMLLLLINDRPFSATSGFEIRPDFSLWWSPRSVELAALAI